MNISAFLKNNWKHFAVVAVFLIITLVYFSPQFSGQSIKQHDVEQYIGSANEAYWFKDQTGNEQLWTNSMFGGMPTTQTSLIYPGNYLGRAVMNFINWFPAPGGMFLLHLLGFYIMLLCFRVNKWVAVVGALAFAFSTYEIIILEAGHNSKSLAVSFLAPVVGFFYLSYRKKMWLGVGMSALFMAFEVSCNHLQVTYYLGILLVLMGITEFILALRKKKLNSFFKSTGLLVVAYLLALGVNYGNISLTNDYAAHTIRGGNDLTLSPEGKPVTNNTKGGLDKDYITNWSYGIGETFTFLIPNAKGGASKVFKGSEFEDFVYNSDLNTEDKNRVLNYPVYWGEQPMTAGPFYMGVIMCFLAFLGLVFLKTPVKWPLFIMGILAVMLSWGKNFMGFTDFWLDYVPGYNKFRTVTIILVIVELIIPLIAILFLNFLLKNREELIEGKKKLIYSATGFIVFLVLVKFVGLNDLYTSSSFDLKQLDRIEAQIGESIQSADPVQLKAQYNVDVNDPVQYRQFIDAQMEPYTENLTNVKQIRSEVFDASVNRSILFSILAFGLLLLLVYTSVNTIIIVAGIGVFSLVDLIGISSKYLSSDEKFWMDKNAKFYPFVARNVDEQILQIETAKNAELAQKIEAAATKKKNELSGEDMKGSIKSRLIDRERFATLNANTNYRVFDFSGGFNSTESSYFHKSLGGYHGAKLRSIQNIFDFHLSKSNNEVYNMLNVKYFIQPGESEMMLRKNNEALGPVWFVEKIKTEATRDAEIQSLGRTFELTNKGQGKLIINDVVEDKAVVYGYESLKYLIGTDTLDVPLTNGLEKGMIAHFVIDANMSANLIPQQTMQMDSLNSFKDLVQIEVKDKFSPSKEAVMLGSEAENISSKTFSGEGTIEMKSYSPMKITYNSSSSESQFAVFSEMYYEDNWKALIDGVEKPIVRVNYCLRGLEIPKGDHTIEFIYDEGQYNATNTVSFIICSLLILFTLFAVWMQVEIKRKENENEVA